MCHVTTSTWLFLSATSTSQRAAITLPPTLDVLSLSLSWSPIRRFCGSHSSMVINAAVRLVVAAGKFDHITPTLRDVLHWLPVRQRILHKVAATAFDCIRGTGRHTSGTFARRSPTSLVGRISVLPNAATCWSLVPELNLVDGASKLQHQPFETLCRHT